MKSDKQNLTEYTPTVKEKALLEILLDPNHRTKSVTKICELAECSRNIYYDAFEKPEFVEYYKQKSKGLVEASLGKVVNAFIKQAEMGSYTHGKIILEMGGLYTEKTESTNKNLNANVELDSLEAAEEYLKSQGIDPDKI